MDKYSHIIRQQVFEVNFSSRERSRDLQDKISSIFNNHLAEEMESLFERIIPRDKLIRVDNLTIDIGEIPFASLDTELTSRVIEKLEEQLSLLLLHDNSAAAEAGSVSSRPQESYLSLLEYFLLKGSLPWWAGSQDPDTPFMAVDFLLAHSAEKLRALIMQAGQKSYVRKRLVYQFGEHQLRSIIGILEPSEAEFIFGYHSEVIKVQREKQPVKSTEIEFKTAVWEFILTYLIVDRGTHFNRKAFVKSTLRSMSAHFNISFRELLQLFGSALIPGSLYPGNTDSLQAIILEINMEEAADNRQALPAEQLTEKTAEDTGAGIDLLRYYLTFGSFPWWSDGRDLQELETFTSGLIREYPQTFESLVRSVGQQQYSRRLIVRTFKEELLQDILKIIEPENAGFIIDYVEEIKVTHTRKAAFKTQSEDLGFAVWEFILEFLLTDRGSEFNRLMFLESNIRKLAARYNVSYREVLVFMVQGIAVSHYDSTRHLSLFHGLSALYKISNEKEGRDSPDLSFNFLQEDTASSAGIIRETNIKNILYFWIRTGYLPWWAGEYAHISPSALLDKFIAGSPADAIIFLKYAGLKENTRKRLVYQVSSQVLFRLFRLLPAGDIAFQYSGRLLALIQEYPEYDHSQFSVYEKVIIITLWNALIVGSYTSPDYRLFIRSALSGLASQLRIPAAQLLRSPELIREPELERFLSGDTDDGNDFPADFGTDLENNEILQLLAAGSKKRLGKKKQADEKNILEEALFVLRYFLQQGRLPGFKEYLSSSLSSFLRQLLLLLLKETPSELNAILSSDGYPGERFLFLHELFVSPGSIEESNLNKIFVSNIEKDILLYVRQQGGLSTDNSVTGFINSYISRPDSWQDTGFIRQLMAYSSVALQLAYHYDNESVYRLMENNVPADRSAGIRTLNSWFLGAVQDRADRERLGLLFRAFNLMLIGGTISAASLNEYMSSFFKFLYERDYQLMLRLSALAGQVPPEDQAGTMNSVSFSDIRQELSIYSGLNEVTSEVEKALYTADEIAQKEIYKDYAGQKDPVARALKKEQEEQKVREKEEEKGLFSDEGAIYIKNAGLVILHPFLSTYFSRLGMLEKGDFLSEDMRQRAVHLLQYLVSGTENNEEHELVLNKILCNIPLEEPVIPRIDLTEHEKTVSAELLNAVLVQWDKLKNTSAESLQASFLQREGALNRIDENWNLKVEQRGYDVLLQTLPWGLGMIKTSWMTEFIYVEWM